MKTAEITEHYPEGEIQSIKVYTEKEVYQHIPLGHPYRPKNSAILFVKKGKIILKPIENPRKNWEIAFQEMHQKKDDQLLVNDLFDNETFEEWK